MIKRIKKEYIDFNEVTKQVETVTGRQTRDWAGAFNPVWDKTKPYQDFWHKFLDLHDVHNGCEVYIDFEEMAEWFKEKEPENYPWIKEICDAYESVLTAEGIDPKSDNNIFWIDW
jgi:hypothetical protein